LGVLSELIVLDALIREIKVRRKRGLQDPRAPYTVILNRLILENNGLKESSARPQASRYLKRLGKEGYIFREKKGRNVFYDVTPKGRHMHLNSMDRLNPSRKWGEHQEQGILYSFAMVPASYGLIHERRGESIELKGKEQIMELVNQIKEQNPELDSLIIRFDQDE
jgi:DNA-binding MarR family transcriptional regulator